MNAMQLVLALLLLISSANSQAGQGDNGLFVFVGRLIEINELKDEPCGEPESDDGEERICISMDSGFRATYEILDQFYGKYDSAQITFDAYDHYGKPAFSRFKHALMFVHVTDDGIYHAKYQFYDVYRTIEGRWATCGDSFARYEEPEELEQIVFSKLNFPEDLVFADVGRFSPSYVAMEFPAEFYDIRSNKAFCKKGVYVEHLVDFKEQTVLKARGLVLEPSKKPKKKR